MGITKPHKTAQLTVSQENAIDALILGNTDREAGEKAGVARETVTRWRNDNADFIAELNRRRSALWAASHDRLRSLVAKAVDVLEQALTVGDTRAAVEVLKATGTYGNIQPPNGPQDAPSVRLAQAQEWARREARLRSPGSPLMLLDLQEDELTAQRYRELTAGSQE